MVVMRYVLGESTVWQSEFTIYAIVGATLIGSLYVLLRRGQVNVDPLPIYLPHRSRLALAFLASLLGLAFCAVLAYRGTELWAEARTRVVLGLSVSYRMYLGCPRLSKTNKNTEPTP